MSFKGIVTRKDKETGVDLLAKIVTANKKKSTRESYRVRIAASGLSDTECCSRAVTRKKEEVQGVLPGGAEDLTTNLNLSSLGEYGTTLTYKIVNDNDDSLLTDYLSANGTLTGVPMYGESDAAGRLYITASKGDASITAVVVVIVKARTAESILYDPTVVSANAFWTAMTTSAPYKLTTNTIRFPETWMPRGAGGVPLSKEPLTATYEVNDVLNAHGMGRIVDNATGDKVVRAPAYAPLYELKKTNTVSANIAEVSLGATGDGAHGLACDGLRVRVTLSLGDKHVNLDYNITTNSAPLSDTEVAEAVLQQAKIKTANNNNVCDKFVVRQYDMATGGPGAPLGYYVVGSFTAPTGTGGQECCTIDAGELDGHNTFCIQCLTPTVFGDAMKLSTVGLREQEVTIAASIKHPLVFAFDARSDYCSGTTLRNEVFAVEEGETIGEYVIPVNVRKIKDAIGTVQEADATMFSISQEIEFTQYDGSATSIFLRKWFYVTNLNALDAV